ncbi:MAG: nuclease [Magnetovibrio sp.]|nr:nuclease [Magnetovibrio sp.]|tara:strand:+ start:499 stop:1002 length:504 start_codon:yes stop_codon:yes gene_type:complete
MCRWLIPYLVIFIGLLKGYPTFSASIKGHAKVIDGDSLVINGKSIRLHGIDAPEGVQWCRDSSDIGYRCGVMATAWMINAISSRQVKCNWVEMDRYKRLLGTCFAGALNLNAGSVQAGWSVAYRRFSTKYVTHEDAARSAKQGLWAGSFEMPWDWRAGIRSKSAASR